MSMIFSTGLCDRLGIEYPILQSGMGGIAGPEVVEAIVREARAVLADLGQRVRLESL